MRNRILLLLLFTISALNVFATHNRSAEITYRWVANNQLQATVTTYTKFSYPSNLADRDTITINWGDGSTSLLPRINGNNDGTCTGASPCGVVIATDIKQSIYTGLHTYTTFPVNSDFFLISYTTDNLLPGIANIDNGNSVNIPMYVSATVYMGSNYNSLPGGMDASPLFLNPPDYYAFMSDTFTYNCAAFDPNGDSLSYTLIVPQQNAASDLPIYIYPDAYCRANGQGQNTMQIDAKTGQLTWASPCTQGFFQIEILISEYRCGFFIGSVSRNMDITVLPDAVSPPVISAVNDVVLQPGQSFQLPITSTNAGSYTDSLQVLGGAFNFSFTSNLPSFQSTTGNPATGTFSWTPGDSFARPYSYLFTVIATNNYTSSGPDGTDPYPASATKSFRVWVQDTTAPCVLTSVKEISANKIQVNIFPNPANSVIDIQTTQPCSGIIISDLLGRSILTIKNSAAEYQVPIALLRDGVYLVTIIIADSKITRRFVKAG